jgi:hypothetical protein
MSVYGNFVSSNDSNVQLSTTNDEQAVKDFEAIMSARGVHPGAVWHDLGGIGVYTVNDVPVAWVDYELYYGYIA